MWLDLSATALLVLSPYSVADKQRDLIDMQLDESSLLCVFMTFLVLENCDSNGLNLSHLAFLDDDDNDEHSVMLLPTAAVAICNSDVNANPSSS